jgi:putative MATE family efflux protein
VKELTSGPPGKLILKFAAPMLLGNLFQQLYNVVDSAIVGKYIGEEALAAVGASFYIIFALIALIIGIATGGTIVISQYFGAKNYERVSATVNTLFILFIICAALLSAFGIVFSYQIFQLINLPEEIIPQAQLYLNTYLLGLITIFGFNGTNAMLRGMGDSMTPLVFVIISTVLNIILDFVFVRILGYGIRSVAFATIIAHTVSLAGGLIYLNKKHALISLNIRKWRFDWDLFGKMSRIGLPTGIQTSFVAFGMVFLSGIINNFGTNVIAAFAGASKIDALAILPAMTFAQALSTYVGQNIGANRMDRVAQGVKATFYISSLICVVITLVILVFGSHMMTWFTDVEDIIRIGTEYLLIVSMFYLVFNGMFIFNGVLRGAGDTLIPMFITLVSLWGLRIPIAHFLSGIESIGEKGIWWAIPIAWFFGMVASFIYYRSGNWRKKAVITQQAKA